MRLPLQVNKGSYHSHRIMAARNSSKDGVLWLAREAVEENAPLPQGRLMDNHDSASSSVSLSSWESDLVEEQENIFNFNPTFESRISKEKYYALPSPCDSFELSRTGSLRMWQQDTEWSGVVSTMKEIFARLLLGEDMSGGAKGASTALTISNAITNLSVSVFEDIWRLEPLSKENKSKWQREMEWLISPCDHIVELVPSAQFLADGTAVEVMVSKPRSDLYIDLPALKKLDAMLLDSLESFNDVEFWYADSATSEMGYGYSQDKLWVPIPKVPDCGLSENARKQLSNQKECANQILKAAKSINEHVLSEMEIPESYWKSLPKSGRKLVGDTRFKIITSEYYCLETLLSTVDRPTQQSLSNLANGLEALIHLWKLQINSRHDQTSQGDTSPFRIRSTWAIGRDMSSREVEKRQAYLERAQNVLMELRQEFPGVLQTSLEMRKIQHNKDIGHAILESYSRALANVASTIQARISDVISAEKDAVLSRLQSSKSHKMMDMSAQQGPLTSPGLPSHPPSRTQSPDNLIHLQTRLEKVIHDENS